MTISGVVTGSVRFPDHPDHIGAWGLVGGEDIIAKRTTFASVGQAMTWCRKVMDGVISPRWEPAGDLLAPRTEVVWAEARVTFRDRSVNEEFVQVWITEPHRRDWHELLISNGTERQGNLARTDPPASTR